MATSTLIAHCGAQVVTRDELARVKTPEPTRTWFPLAHSTVLERVETTLKETGFHIENETLAMTRAGARFFATLDLASSIVEGVTLAVGVRNSIDKSLPIGFAAGHRVLVCDNLAFRGEVSVARKHSRFGETRFGEALVRASRGLEQFQAAEAARVTRFRATHVSPVQAESLMLRAYERDIVSHRLLPRVIAEYRKPSHQAFAEPTLWSLFNAFTGVLGERQRTNPQQFAALTIRLSDLLGEYAGIRPEETFQLSA